MASSNAYQYVTLKEKDVPGAQLIYPEVENHSNVQLKRWLLCRGLTTTGNKSILIERYLLKFIFPLLQYIFTHGKQLNMHNFSKMKQKQKNIFEF